MTVRRAFCSPSVFIGKLGCLNAEVRAASPQEGLQSAFRNKNGIGLIPPTGIGFHILEVNRDDRADAMGSLPQDHLLPVVSSLTSVDGYETVKSELASGGPARFRE